MTNSPRNLRRDFAFAFVLALACYVAWLVREVLVLLYVSAMFAVMLGPLVRSTARLHIGRWHFFKGTAIFFLLFGAAAAITAFGFLALPPVIREFAHLEGDVIIAGNLDHIELWNPQRYADQVSEASEIYPKKHPRFAYHADVDEV